MGSKRVPLLVGVAVAGTTLLTATALGAVTQSGPRTGHVEMAAGLTSSVTQNGVQVKAAAGAARAAVGFRVPLTVTVRSQETQIAVVDLEVNDPHNRRVFQRTWTGLTLVGGRSSTLTVEWTAPSVAGRYRIAVGVFTDGWGSLLAWNNQAAFVVVAPARTVAPATQPSSSKATPAGTTPSTTVPTTPSAPTDTPTVTATAAVPTTDTAAPPGLQKGRKNGVKPTPPGVGIGLGNPMASLPASAALPSDGG
jgi:hypothetical protein